VQRAFFAGIAAGTLTALAADSIGSALGLEALGAAELTTFHVTVAALVVNVAGAVLLTVLHGRVARPRVVYAGVALVLASLASLKVFLFPPQPGFALIATTLHYVVALCSVGAFALLSPIALADEAVDAHPLGAGRTLLSVAATATAPVGLLADFNASHIFNPAWAPHARFHGVLFAATMAVNGWLALWLLWGRAAAGERRLRATTAALLTGTLWGVFFLAWLVPSVSIWPDGFVQRAPVNGNLVLAGLVVALSFAGWRLERRAHPRV